MPQPQYWQHMDLTQAARGVAAPMFSDPTAYVTQDPVLGPIARVLYLNDYGNGGDIHEIRNQGGIWMPDADLSLLLTNYTGDFQGRWLATGYVTPDGIPRVVFQGLDNWIYEFRLPPGQGWTVANLCQVASLGIKPAQNAVAWPYVTPDDQARVVYRGSDSDVYELRLNTSQPNATWFYADLTALAIAGGWDAPGSSNDPFGYVSGDKIARVVYNDNSSNDVQELRLESSGWINANLCQLANANAPPGNYAPPGNGLDVSAYVTPDAIARVLYVGNDSHAHELLLVSNESPWVHTDLTHSSGAQTNPYTWLYGYCGSDSVPRVLYFGTDNHLHQFSYENTWTDEDVFLNVVKQPPGGIVATGYQGSAAYFFEFQNGIWIIYNGADQHIHLLTPLVVEGQMGHMRSGWAADLRKALARNGI